MSLDSQRAGFHRVTQVMMDMMEAVASKDKKQILNLADSLAESVSSFVEVAIADGEVTARDLENSDEDQIDEMAQEAATGAQSMKIQARQEHKQA